MRNVQETYSYEFGTLVCGNIFILKWILSVTLFNHCFILLVTESDKQTDIQVALFPRPQQQPWPPVTHWQSGQLDSIVETWYYTDWTTLKWTWATMNEKLLYACINFGPSKIPSTQTLQSCCIWILTLNYEINYMDRFITN